MEQKLPINQNWEKISCSLENLSTFSKYILNKNVFQNLKTIKYLVDTIAIRF